MEQDNNFNDLNPFPDRDDHTNHANDHIMTQYDEATWEAVGGPGAMDMYDEMFGDADDDSDCA